MGLYALHLTWEACDYILYGNQITIHSRPYSWSISINSVLFFAFWFSRKMCKLSTKFGSNPWPNFLLQYSVTISSILPPCLLFQFLLLSATEAQSLNTMPSFLGLSDLLPKGSKSLFNRSHIASYIV